MTQPLNDPWQMGSDSAWEYPIGSDYQDATMKWLKEWMHCERACFEAKIAN